MEQALGVDRLVGTTVLSHKLVVSLRLVVLMQLVKFDDLDELVGVLWVGGIAALFQTSRPTLVVAGAEVEETGIARLASQELAVVFVALLGIAIYTEAFSTSVVIVILLRTHPRGMALDAEVVVALSHEVASSRSTLEESLCQGDAGRYAVSKHLLDGEILVLVDVCLIGLVPFHLRTHRCGGQEEGKP